MSTPPKLPTLTGKSVTLRAPHPSDAAGRLALGRDPQIARMYGASIADVREMTLQDAERWIDSILKHGHAWIIVTGKLIGHIRLDRIDLKARRASMAIGIDDPASLGRGHGSESIGLLLARAFGDMRLHRISLRVVAYNQRAIRAYEKCGFRIEGREREAALVDGQWHDDVMMGILDREFSAAPLQ